MRIETELRVSQIPCYAVWTLYQREQWSHFTSPCGETSTVPGEEPQLGHLSFPGMGGSTPGGVVEVRPASRSSSCKALRGCPKSRADVIAGIVYR